ncbi:hypothetical protein ACS0PU_009096 [Formica fusca]
MLGAFSFLESVTREREPFPSTHCAQHQRRIAHIAGTSRNRSGGPHPSPVISLDHATLPLASRCGIRKATECCPRDKTRRPIITRPEMLSSKVHRAVSAESCAPPDTCHTFGGEYHHV